MTIRSDQGFQYQNYKYTSRLKENRIIQSMSRKATCLDNAMDQSKFHIIKVGTVHNNNLNYEELNQAVKEYIYHYNNKRIETKLAGMTSVEYRNDSSQPIV